MPTTKFIEATKLHLDLKNPRTTPQDTELDAIHAMIAIKSEKFFAVLDSILDDGYLLTESILILKKGAKLTVKEGNRRIAALKLINGKYKLDDFPIPNSIRVKIDKLDAKWKKENSKVLCAVYGVAELDKVEKIVGLTHGKGEKASRDPWTSVARARHNRDINKAPEPALDLLEKYILNGKNLNLQQKERWSGDYNLTVLEEALRHTHNRLGFTTVADLTHKYPKVKLVAALEDMMLNIGNEALGFKQIRDTHNDFAVTYGFPPLPPPTPPAPPIPPSVPTTGTGTPTPGTPTPSTSKPATPTPGTGTGTPTPPTGTGTSTSSPGTNTPSGPKAFSITDSKHVASLLKKFTPVGANREKVVALRNEVKLLTIKDNPIAFCFLLRSMFEISAKVYATEHRISLKDPKGYDKKLAVLLKDVTNHLIAANPGMFKPLHGAKTEITKPEGILSVTSMNQLVHNPSFSITAPDICTLFGNIYPLLEAMN
jgi:hypothetical protein